MGFISFVTTVTGSGGGTPGGSSTQVQFNDGGAFGGSAGLTYDKTTQTLTGAKIVSSTGFTGSLQGTASHASTAAAAALAADSTLFDGRSSTSFAGLTANTFTGIQTFSAPVTGSSAYFSGDIVIAGTASISMLETRNQQTLMLGDKYIVILSGAADHVDLDGAGLLFGSGSSLGVTDTDGANAYLRYRNTYGKLEIFPGLRVSGSVNATGGFSAGYQTYSSNFTVTSNNYFCGVSTSAGAVTASLSLASTFAAGQTIIIKDTGGFAASAGKGILVNAAGSDKIDGLSSVSIAMTSGTINLMSDGSSKWFITNY